MLSGHIRAHAKHRVLSIALFLKHVSISHPCLGLLLSAGGEIPPLSPALEARHCDTTAAGAMTSVQAQLCSDSWTSIRVDEEYLQRLQAED